MEASAGHADIFTFPGGSRTGNFFHDLFEDLDYTDCSFDALSEPVGSALQAYGFDRKWQDVVCETIEHVLTVSLKPAEPDLALSSIAFEHRINEMEFYFPLNRITPQQMRSVFQKNGGIDSGAHFPDWPNQLVFNPVAGFMKGYIDLVFQHRNRFYLVDWKSNTLGPTPESYCQEALQSAMQHNFYILQYHLYMVALCQYLRMRHPDFEYGSNFGGIFYLFIRGINRDRGPEYGVYFDLPEAALINALGKFLIPGFSEI
jgi:exodeoxyribonuclease V beta subunit